MKVHIPSQLLLPWSPKHTISVAQTAEMLQISEDTVLRMIRDKEIMAYKLRRNTSRWKVYYHSVLDYIDKMHDEHGLEKRFSL